MQTRSPSGSAVGQVVIALVLVMLTAGCGQTVSVGRNRILQVSLTEYHVAPQSVHAAAGTLSIYVHNYGRLTHNLVITRDGETWASSQPIPPGQTTEVIARLTPGQYLIASTILSDQALGAYGTLIVGS